MSDCISDVCSSDLSGSVYWNITAGDFAHASGWIGAGTGLLAIDLNEDGIINDPSELFGTQTTTGFTILAGYESDTDYDIELGRGSSRERVVQNVVLTAGGG